MENKEVIKKYAITKKTRIFIVLQMVLLAGALLLSLIGVFKSLDMINSINRIIVYGFQALVCLATLIFGLYYFNKKETKYFRSVLIAYALLEAVRVSLLQTGGIGNVYSFLAKFVLVLLAIGAALLSNKTDKKEGLYLARIMLGLECALYVIFLIGFPAVRTRLLFLAVPWVGVLMAGAMCLFVRGRLEQIRYTNEAENEDPDSAEEQK